MKIGSIKINVMSVLCLGFLSNTILAKDLNYEEFLECSMFYGQKTQTPWIKINDSDALVSQSETKELVEAKILFSLSDANEDQEYSSEILPITVLAEDDTGEKYIQTELNYFYTLSVQGDPGSREYNLWVGLDSRIYMDEMLSVDFSDSDFVDYKFSTTYDLGLYELKEPVLNIGFECKNYFLPRKK